MKHTRLADFKNIHDGACWVCGTGPSLQGLMENEKYLLFPTIGVNTISMDYFDPDYLVVVDRVQYKQPGDAPQWHSDREEFIHNSKAPYVFSTFDNIYTIAQWIPIRLEPLARCDPEYIHRKGRLFSQFTVTITAISLAIWMGFKQIGVSGFDLHGHRAGKGKLKLNEACTKIKNYCAKIGVEVLNVSDQSLIDTLPECTVEQFIKWYGG